MAIRICTFPGCGRFLADDNPGKICRPHLLSAILRTPNKSVPDFPSQQPLANKGACPECEAIRARTSIPSSGNQSAKCPTCGRIHRKTAGELLDRIADEVRTGKHTHHTIREISEIHHTAQSPIRGRLKSAGIIHMVRFVGTGWKATRNDSWRKAMANDTRIRIAKKKAKSEVMPYAE